MCKPTETTHKETSLARNYILHIIFLYSIVCHGWFEDH